MAVLKVLKCQNCSSPLKPGQVECTKCHHHNVIVEAEINPLKMTNEMAQQYIDVFKQQAEDNPKDTNALFAMGLFYLGLKNYELAQRNFKMAVDLQPTEPDMYYYYALSLFEGKSPQSINTNKAERIEEWLHTATNIQSKRKYLILQMFLRQGAYVANGLQVHGELPDELMTKIQTMMPEPDELLEITEHTHLSDPRNLEYLQILRGEKSMKDNRDKSYDTSYYNSFNVSEPTERDNGFSTEDIWSGVERLKYEREREEFFDYLYEPTYPQAIEAPSYPIGNMIKRLLIMAAMTFVFFIVEGIVGYSMSDFELRDPNLTVKQEYEELYGKKNLSSKERREKMEELRADSIENVAQAEAYLAEHHILAYTIVDPDNNEDEITKFCYLTIPEEAKTQVITEYGGIEKNYRALLTLLFLLSPFIVFVAKTIVRFSRVAKERNEIDVRNMQNIARYNEAVRKHNTRPTIPDMVEFCREFLSKDERVIPFGDPVKQVLQECNIYNEADVPGKILFVNYFVQRDTEDPEYNYSCDPYHVLSRIEYVIAIPQRDCLIINSSFWDTLSNMTDGGETTRLFYRNINSISKEDGNVVIELNGTQKEIYLGSSGENLLTYQSCDSSDETTFSLTRTGNPNEFIAAVNQLINAFHTRS